MNIHCSISEFIRNHLMCLCARACMWISLDMGQRFCILMVCAISFFLHIYKREEKKTNKMCGTAVIVRLNMCGINSNETTTTTTIIEFCCVYWYDALCQLLFIFTMESYESVCLYSDPIPYMNWCKCWILADFIEWLS